MPLLGKAACRVFLMFPLPCMQQILVYPKSMGCLSYCSPSFCYKSYCFFFELPIMFPMPLALFHFTPPKVMWLYCKPNLSVCPLFRGKISIFGKNVVRFDEGGNIVAQMEVTTSEYGVREKDPFGASTRRPLIAEYGEPVISPNGDVYTWKR